MNGRITRKMLDQKFEYLVERLGANKGHAPGSLALDCYAPDGRTLCRVVELMEHGAQSTAYFGAGRHTVSELFWMISFALDAIRYDRDHNARKDA